MRELFRSLPLMCVVLLVPVLPFLLWGGRFEAWLRAFESESYSDTAIAGLVAGLLATDILLPIPSSVLSTMGGWQLGWWLGTLVSWAGMTLGAVIGFAIARRWGRPVALWFSRDSDLDRMHALSERYGPVVLAVCRAVPVLAEASVLIVGIHRVSWRRFLPVVTLSNLGVSLAYAAFGDYAQHQQWLPLALGFAIALPVAMAAAAHPLIRRRTKP